MKRSSMLIVVAMACVTLGLSAQTKRAAAPAAHTTFTVVEATMADMRSAMEQGRVTSRDLVQQYLTASPSTTVSCTRR